MNEQQQPKRNTTCLDAGQLIAWRDGALSLRETDEVTAHLAGCARCAAEDRALMRDRHRVFDLLASLDPPPNTDAEPAIALTRFQERLTAQNTGSLLQHSEENMHPGALPPARSEREDAIFTPLRLSIPGHHLARALVAALVIAALLGTILLLLRPSLPSTGGHPKQAPTAPPIGPVGTPVTVDAQAGGLEMTMQITPGPYFLSEMLVADLSLTNHSPTTFLLQGTPNVPGQRPDTCHPPLTIAILGGEGPSDTALRSALADIASCWNGPGSEGTVQLQPGQTIAVHQYLALTSSGHVTLTTRATFQKAALGQDGVVHIIPASGPLDGHWPALQVSVARQIPSARSITLQRQGLQVHVDAPPAIRDQLLYMSVFICDLGPRSTQRSGADNWIAPPGETIPPPQCGFSMDNGTATPFKLERWTYVAGAPGYAIASGTYPS